jgi:hypothetical protein
MPVSTGGCLAQDCSFTSLYILSRLRRPSGWVMSSAIKLQLQLLQRLLVLLLLTQL